MPKLLRPTPSNKTLVFEASFLFDCPDCPANANEQCMGYVGSGPKRTARHLYTPLRRCGPHAARRLLGEYSITKTPAPLSLFRSPEDRAAMVIFTPEKWYEIYNEWPLNHTPVPRVRTTRAHPPTHACHAPQLHPKGVCMRA